MIFDAHVHLDHQKLNNFVQMISTKEDDFSFFSNSVDYHTSLLNVKLSKTKNSIKAFVGIHPEIFARQDSTMLTRSDLDTMIQNVGSLFAESSGVGEIGLDKKYGSIKDQEYLLESLLELAEPTRLPITFHCRDSISRILEIIPSYNVQGNMLFHWFAGSESELRSVHERGIYTSFGPSIIASKRMSALVQASTLSYVLAETDSPIDYGFLDGGMSTPYLITSVLFKMSLILGISFSKLVEILEKNSIVYLRTQNSLRVN